MNSGRSTSGAVALLFAALTLGRPARAQSSGATGSLERFHPAPAGDAMFGGPSPSVGGHLVPRAAAVFDFASRPLSIQGDSGKLAIVESQLFLHLDVSFALFDRLLVSVDMPFGLAQSGASPTVLGVPFASPKSAQVGDLRLGARADPRRLLEEEWLSAGRR